jgi:hypothetical protein
MGSMGETDCKTCKGTGLEPVSVEFKSDVIKMPENEKFTVMSIELKPVEPTVELILSESVRHPQLAEGECFTTNNWVPSDGMLEHGGLRKGGIKSTVETWSDDALTMKGGDIGKAEALEHIVETHEAALANLGKPSNCFEPEVSKSSETMAERLKRKYTKSTK